VKLLDDSPLKEELIDKSNIKKGNISIKDFSKKTIKNEKNLLGKR
jgi:hypothetical protein